MNGMISLNALPEISGDLYRSFLLTYGISALGRMALECYKQIAILETAWYDVPTAAFNVLGHGFAQHILLSFAAAEVLNMVFGALYKIRVRQEAREEARAKALKALEENNKAWEEWLRRKAEAEAKGEPFNEPSPAEQPIDDKP